jgi:uncharacterized protein DUF6455
MGELTMNPTLLEIGGAVFAAAMSVALVVWFSRHAASHSEKRMMHMLMCAGVDPGFSGHDDTWPILQVARGRCGRCRAGDMCDRWLAGKVEGDNSFCYNAQIFRILKRITRRIAASTRSGQPDQATTLTPGTRNVLRTGIGHDASIRLYPSINSPISAVL